MENKIKELEQKLLRKEQECEELKNELIDVKWKIEAQDIELNGNEEQLDQLKTENEQLLKSVRSNKDKRKRAIEKYIRLKEFTNKNFNQFEIDMEKAENERLKKALQEIKEIVQNRLSLVCKDCVLKQCKTCEAKQILEKCEVIDD